MRGFRTLWNEPAVPNPPVRVWRDWALLAILVPTALVEAILRTDTAWPALGVVGALVALSALPYRRTRPLAATTTAFGAGIALSVASLFHDGDTMIGLYTMAAVLIIPYALFRWGSGRQIVIGDFVLFVAWVLGNAAEWGGVGEAAGGLMVMFFPAAVGAAVRYKDSMRERELEEVRLREREQFARELHDTVAHHVSAIAVQAQAARTVAACKPEAVDGVLEVIEEAASRTLDEMRSMVGALRSHDDPDLSPQPGVADIERLAEGAIVGPPVQVDVRGDLHDVRPSVDAALYRLAQESITNAVRHARHATRIDVSVIGDPDHVRLSVRDDGDATSFDADAASGFGLVGMAERAKLLGGTLRAGPGPGKGWRVEAVLPRNGVAS